MHVNLYVYAKIMFVLLEYKSQPMQYKICTK